MAVVVVAPPAATHQPQAAPPCEQRLVTPSPDPNAYKPRGTRCEGVYLQNVSSVGSLAVVSFTTTLQAIAIVRGTALLLEWDETPDVTVTLRAMSLRRGLYYRMDAAPPAGAARFEWPTDVLVPLGLKVEELGLVGWGRRTVGTTAQDVYVPIRIAGTAADSRRYVFRIVPATALRELHVTLANVDRSGHDGKVIVNNEPLRRGPYPAERAITISLPPLPTLGLYRLQLNALLDSGAPLSRSLYFDHAGG